ncbi:hypothetical protein P154DRAFT_579194 [Amniculicola lignicola CBS 123094]|uniref:Uncharacterized protein n=1 Tax=Amniculicola lignicola CBS 123094 TaxID=1392246 RepID=A0A6A5WHC5_9PLEO|nr:hypothetical protein P154DRAFT_579194 [Amniculicola lignicola CBS 123094]
MDKPETGNQLIAAFIATKDDADCVKNLTKLSTEEGTFDVDQLTALAIITHNVPDVSKELKAVLPPSENQSIARELFIALCREKVISAILHVMGSVYLSSDKDSRIKDRAAKFVKGIPLSDLRVCRQELEALSQTGDPDAMALLGQFLEREGRSQQAIDLYQKAISIIDPIFDFDEWHVQSAPRTPPWISLATTFLPSKDAKSQEQAKEALKFGALEGDDPLAYYLLASHFTPKENPDWLTYMTKAAASGHIEAAYQVGNFYVEANNASTKAPFIKPALLSNPGLKKSLSWLAYWKPLKAMNMAEEWFMLAAKRGHKPSMLEMADWAETSGDEQKLGLYLRAMIEKPGNGVERWPGLVLQAHARLKAMGWKMSQKK